jgi:hypothetical protein
MSSGHQPELQIKLFKEKVLDGEHEISITHERNIALSVDIIVYTRIFNLTSSHTLTVNFWNYLWNNKEIEKWASVIL